MLDRPANTSLAALGAIRIAEAGPLLRIIFRARDEAVMERAGSAFGVPLPRRACRFEAAGSRRAMWLGPDEWMLVAEGGDAGTAAVLALHEALAWETCSVVDVSDRSRTLTLSGEHAAEVLAAGCPLDLAESAFPTGMCTRTVFAKAEIVLTRTGPASFEVDVWRSFAPYVREMLELAALEYTPT